MTPISILVPPGLARYADHHGTRLAEFRKGGRDNNNLIATQERKLEMHILGARGEATLYRFFGGFWGGAKWDTSISNDRAWGKTPDIIFRGVKYDAKGIDRNKLSLVVYKGGVHAEWRYVLVGTQFWPEAELLGWCTGADVLTVPLEEKIKDRPAHYVKQTSTLLRSCTELPTATREERIAKWYSYLPQDPDECQEHEASDESAKL